MGDLRLNVDLSKDEQSKTIMLLSETIINVPYHSQRDNAYFPNSTCGSTCLGMILEHLNNVRITPKPFVFSDDDIMNVLADDDVVKKIISLNKSYASYAKKRKDPITNKTTKFNYMNNIFAALGIAGEILTNYEYLFKLKYRTKQEIEASIQAYMPFTIAARFQLNATKTIGHYINIVGMDAHNFICHDPYGDWYSKYNNHNGAFVRYRKEDVYKAIELKTGLMMKSKTGEKMYFSMKPVLNMYVKAK